MLDRYILAQHCDQSSNDLLAERSASQCQRATDAIFYPSMADPKPSLLKCGTIDLVNNEPNSEQYLLVFTHGFVVANVNEIEALDFFLALNQNEILTSESFSSFLESKFRVVEKESGKHIFSVHACFLQSYPLNQQLYSVQC